MHKGSLLAGLVAAALPLAGCLEDATPRPGAAAGADAAPRARAAAEERVRAAARDGSALRFRAVETHRQAMAGTYAVCGQATVSGGGVFIPFVSVVSAVGGGLEVEQHLARTNTEATRVYVEMVGRCFDGGGPLQRAGGTPVAQPTPPLPNGLPILDQPEHAPARAPDPVVAASAAGAGSVTMRQNGNLRSSPGGGGAVIRVARAGASMTVFGTAPGGWFQVGDTAPEGWVHGSVASRMDGASSGTLASVQ